ncbi:hypothetical protein QPK32_09225 [Massilia sp. YIM B02763]|uniref:hypothetical protein n=1 Tax=Massilia sp. YIM B02763 TaxID=3050130 RepID=UPI0025B64921|nr:hypothetical protein [Massilia sp. YIM B02763]MDN4053261.1 hypothetical protein [Massilia sp. YIM B02763]
MKFLVVLLAGALAACQAWQANAPAHQGAETGAGMGAGSSTGSSGAAGSATASGEGEHAAMSGHHAMCTFNQRLQRARTPEERQAILAQAMPDMLPEEREQHLLTMQRQCR